MTEADDHKEITMNKVLATLFLAVPLSFAAQTPAAPATTPATPAPAAKTTKKHVKKVKKNKVQKTDAAAPVTNNAVPAKK